MNFNSEQNDYIRRCIETILGGLVFGLSFEAEFASPFLDITATSDSPDGANKAIPTGKWAKISESTIDTSTYGLSPLLAEQMTRAGRSDEIPPLLLKISRREPVSVVFHYQYHHRPFVGLFNRWTPDIGLPDPHGIWEMPNTGDITDTIENFKVDVQLKLFDEKISLPTFLPLPKRRPRKYGRSALPRWLEIYRELTIGRKFTRQTKRLQETPNERGFGKEGTEEWKDKLLRGAKNAVGRVAKDAIKSAVDSAVKEGGKRVVQKTLTKALGDRLKKIDDWSKRKD